MEMILIIIVLIIDYFIIKSTINEYKAMKKAKHKAMIWNANIK